MYQLCLAKDDFPLAMVALLERERWIGRERLPAVYLWYLSGAPAAAVAARGARPKMITAAALDIALTVSMNGPARGRLWLHAAPEGGQKLMDWYRARGLENVPPGIKLPGPRISERINDGRYFCVSEARAGVVLQSMRE